MAIGVSGRPSVRETLAREKARMAQQQQQQGQFDPQKLAEGVLRGDVSANDIAILQSLGKVPLQQEIDVSSLISDRAKAKEQGLDTNYFDEILKKAGFTEFDKTESQLSDKETKALNALQNLKTLFGRGSAETVGGKGDLSQRTGRGLVGNLLNILNVGRNALGIFGGGKSKEDYQMFKASLESAAPLFTQALGSGTPQEGEFKRLLESAPSIKSTNKEAEMWFKQMESLLSGKPLSTVGGGDITTSTGNTFTIIEE